VKKYVLQDLLLLAHSTASQQIVPNRLDWIMRLSIHCKIVFPCSLGLGMTAECECITMRNR